MGTVSVEKIELLSKSFEKKGIAHEEKINAKNHGRDEIIAKAGHKGKFAIIATSMAGRGTDIQLGDGILEMGDYT